MKKGFESILDTVMTLGPDALRKALPSLSEDQKVLLKEVLEKAKASLPMDTGPQDGQELVELASKKAKSSKERAGEADEHMIKPAANEIRHQGDASELDGQLIKAKEKAGVPNDEKEEQGEINAMESGRADPEEDEEEAGEKQQVAPPADRQLDKAHIGFDKLVDKLKDEKHPPEDPKAVAAKIGMEKYGKKGMEAKAHAGEMKKSIDASAIVARMKEKGLAKAECLAAAESKGESELAKAIKAEWKDEESPIEKEAAAEGESEEQETNEKAAGAGKEKAAEKRAKEMKKEDAKGVPMAMEKSIPWTNGTSRLLEASTRRGQNAHYTVEETLLKAEADQAETLKKGGYLNDMSGEELAKSEGAPAPKFRKSYAEDMIVAGADMNENKHRRLTQNIHASKPGKFSVQSFAEQDLAKSMGISEEKAREILGDVKPTDKK